MRECLVVCPLDSPLLLPLAVHRAALACGSEFFGAMLLSGMRNPRAQECLSAHHLCPGPATPRLFCLLWGCAGKVARTTESCPGCSAVPELLLPGSVPESLGTRPQPCPLPGSDPHGRSPRVGEALEQEPVTTSSRTCRLWLCAPLSLLCRQPAWLSSWTVMSYTCRRVRGLRGCTGVG